MEKPKLGNVVYKKIVMVGDLNPAHTLYGGKLTDWVDEAAGIFALELIEPDKHFVTLKISELLFEHPARLGDILTFYAKVIRIGRTSLGVSVAVMRQVQEIVTCDITFVSVDAQGRPTPHGLDPSLIEL